MRGRSVTGGGGGFAARSVKITVINLRPLASPLGTNICLEELPTEGLQGYLAHKKTPSPRPLR